MKRFVIVIVVLVLLVGFLKSIIIGKDATQAITSTGAAIKSEIVPVPTVTPLPPASPSNRHFALADIVQAYKKDKAGADKRFKSRRFGVSGQVESVQPDYLGLLVENVARVQAMLDARGVSDARAIKVGQSVVLSCVGDGTGFYAVELVDCHVVTKTSLMPRDKPPVFSPLPKLPDYPTTLQCIASNQRENWIGSASDWQAACLDGESQDESWLVGHWREFEPKIRYNCLENGERKLSYTYLKTCLEVGGI